MSVTGVSNSSTAQSIYQLYASQLSSSSSSTSTSSTNSTGSTKADSAHISKSGELFSKLQQLQSTDPEKFKEVCSNIAEKLKSAAEESGDTKLSDLAEKFQNVADGGDISQLQPPKPPASGMKPLGIESYSKDDKSS